MISTATIVAFFMVFLIQNTQNRDALAARLKLDEIIKSIDNAGNEIIRAEDETDEQLSELLMNYADLCNVHGELRGRLGLPV